MTKKKHRQQATIPAQLIALIVGGVLLVAAALFFAFGGGDGGGTPKLAVDQEKIDFGDVHFGDGKSFAIKVTNTGDGVLRFKEKPYVQVLEGC
jgi:hypothetical protein